MGLSYAEQEQKTGKWLKPQAWNNTRDDKIRSSGLWKGAFEARRCLVPATAYAEATGRNPATFHWFNVKGADAFACAGIWKHQAGMVGETEVDGVFHSVVTTSPNKLAEKYHNRMPVILAPRDYETWLTGDDDDVFELFEPFADGQLQLVGDGVGLREEPM